MKTLKITTDNKISIIDLDFDHESLREEVGGYVELVRTQKLLDYFKTKVVMIVDEEGLVKNLPVNPMGCYFYDTDKHGKRSMDRASGSGVFARDPDAMLDLIELDVTDDLRKQEQNKTVCATCQTYLDSHFGWEDDLSQDDLCSQVQMMNYCREHLSPMQMRELQKQIDTNLITTNTRQRGVLMEL